LPAEAPFAAFGVVRAIGSVRLSDFWADPSSRIGSAMVEVEAFGLESLPPHPAATAEEMTRIASQKSNDFSIALGWLISRLAPS